MNILLFDFRFVYLTALRLASEEHTFNYFAYFRGEKLSNQD